MAPTGENNYDSWPSLLKVATETLLEVSKDKNSLQLLTGLIRTKSGIQHSIEGPNRGNPGPAGEGLEPAEFPNTAVSNEGDPDSVHRREDVEFFDEERLI